jgi:hypothetical protein
MGENPSGFQGCPECPVENVSWDDIQKFLKKLKKSGCYMLKFGAESGSQRVLDFLKKDIKVEDIIRSCKECHEAGITPNYSFMTALPTETKDERVKTLELIDKLRKIAPEAVIISPQPYRPYPGGELADMVQSKYGFKFPEELDGWAGIVSQSIDSSMSDLEHFPWVKNPDSIRLQRMVSTIMMSRKGKKFQDRLRRVNLMLTPAVMALYAVATMRWKLKFFDLPLEYSYVFGSYKKFYR